MKLPFNFYRRTIFLLVNTNFFDFFRDFLKWKELFRIEEKYFLTNLLSGYWKRIFCLVEKMFLTCFYSVFLLVEIIIGIRGKPFSRKKLILASGQLIFLASGNHFFFSIFQILLPMQVFFRLVEKYFSTKSLILFSGNGF